MTTQQVAAANAPAAAPAIEESGVAELRASFRGTLLRPGNPDYEQARRVWNGMIDRRPALIARCAGAADVIRAVSFARERGSPLAVRGGGHNVAGNAVCDGGLVIDLSPMKAIRVDPARRTARAEGGVTWGEFDRETQAFGLATTGGIVSTTGIAGLTLGGGHRVARAHLRARLRQPPVRGPRHRRRTAPDRERDRARRPLLGRARAAAGTSASSPRFEYRLHPVGPRARRAADSSRSTPRATCSGSTVISPRPRLRELTCLRRLADFARGSALVAIAVCYNGPLEDGERLLRPLRASAPRWSTPSDPCPTSSSRACFDAGSTRPAA